MNPKSIPFPKSWPCYVQSIILQVISLTNYVLIYTRSWGANSRLARVRLKAELDDARQEIALLREELCIKDERVDRIPAHHRPHYTAIQRMAILEIKAARRLNVSQIARRFLLKPTTISNWLKRIDERGPNALIQLCEPVNRFPDLVKVVTRRLKTLCPSLGKSQIAKLLTRAGLHLGVTTVERFLQEKDQPPVKDRSSKVEGMIEEQTKTIRADYPNHVWGVDLTMIPTAGGYWVPWSPRSLPNYWPFCWWLAFVIDHYSRRVIGFAIFKKYPTSGQVLDVLRRAMFRAKAMPRHLICDQGSQFIAEDFQAWCRNKKRNITLRYGAVGKHGSIAVIERFIRTIKQEYLHRITIPFRQHTLCQRIAGYVNWYNAYRPHAFLNGATPLEIYEQQVPANRKPRYEPREKWPITSGCATPLVPVKDQPGIKLKLVVNFLDKEKLLPVIELHQAA